jgi:hypothetical protein
MPTPKECRQHAEECLRLANETTQVYARQALLELAAEFREIAEELESRSSPFTRGETTALAAYKPDAPSPGLLS